MQIYFNSTIKYFLCFVILGLLPKIAYAKLSLTVDESISDNAYLRIIESDSEDVTLSLVVYSEELDDSLIKPLVIYFIEQGVDYKYKFKNNKLNFILRFPTSQLSENLDFLRNSIRASFKKVEFVDLLLSGKFNQQKILGRIHSQWAKIKAKSDSDAIFNYKKALDSDLSKNKVDYWTQIFSLLLTCDSQEPTSVNFVITNTNFSCILRKSPKTLSAGDIANKKAEIYQWFLINENNLSSLAPLIQSFRQEKSAESLQEFINYLPELSIEEISTLYHSYNAENIILAIHEQVPFNATRSNGVSKKILSYITLLPRDSEVWSFSWELSNSENICEIINCKGLRARTNFQVIKNDKTWLITEVNKSNLEQELKFIVDEIVKPLNLVSAFRNTQFIAIGPDNVEQISPLVNAINFSSIRVWQPARDNKSSLLFVANGNNLCANYPQIGSSSWFPQLVTQYYWHYLDAKSGDLETNSWSLWDSSCIDPQIEPNDRFITDKKLFSKMKSALINRAEATNYDSFKVRTLSQYYQLNVQEFLLNGLKSLTFEEYQYLVRNYQ